MNKRNYTIVRRIGLAILLISVLLTSLSKAVKETGTLEFLDRYPQAHSILGGCFGSATVGATINGLGIRQTLLKRREGIVVLLYGVSFLYSHDLTARHIENRKIQKKSSPLIIKILSSSFAIGLCSLGAIFL